MKDIFDIEQLTQFEFGAIIITILIAGLVFGCLIAWGILNRNSSPKAVAAEKAKEEFEEYKEKVDEHFTQTSEMFKDVTIQYKKLYDHMAVGAVSLGNADTIAMPRLEMQDSEEESEKAAEEPDIDQTEEVVEQDPIAEDTSSKNIDETVENPEEIEEILATNESNAETVEKQVADNVEQATDEIADQQGQGESKTS